MKKCRRKECNVSNAAGSNAAGKLFLKVTTVNGNTITVDRAQAGRSEAAHAAGAVVYAFSDDMELNLPVGPDPDESAATRMLDVVDDLQQAMGTYNPTLVPMPILFGNNPNAPGGLLAKSANVVNCLNHTDGKVYYSKTGCAVFETHIANKVPGAQAVDVWNFHCAEGEIHCGSAAIRNLPLQPRWWEEIENWE